MKHYEIKLLSSMALHVIMLMTQFVAHWSDDTLSQHLLQVQIWSLCFTIYNFESFSKILLVEAGSHMFLGYTMKNRWRHGRRWWMQFMPKVPSFSANCGMLAVHLIKVACCTLLIWKLMLCNAIINQIYNYESIALILLLLMSYNSNDTFI